MRHCARIVGSPAELPPSGPRTVTIGNFDGVHLGHREILTSMAAVEMTSTVITFDPHPRTFFGGEVPEISSLRRRLELLAATGVDEILVLPFDAEMASLAPDTWVQRYLRPIETRVVVVGEDFRFGRARGGDVPLLRQMGYEVRPVQLLTDVSSSRVRDLVARGELPGAARMLGRSHEVEVTVVDTVRRDDATTLVLETNARMPVLPPSGRYAARVAGRPAVVAWMQERLDLHARVRAWDGAIGEHLRLALSRALPAG